MEKITKEELIEQLKLAGLTDEKLQRISGGSDSSKIDEFMDCVVKCESIGMRLSQEMCMRKCEYLIE